MVISELLKAGNENIPQNRAERRNHYPKKIGKRVRCRICSSKKTRTQTFYVCDICKDKDGNSIGLCVDPCFKDYHENSA